MYIVSVSNIAILNNIRTYAQIMLVLYMVPIYIDMVV